MDRTLELISMLEKSKDNVLHSGPCNSKVDTVLRLGCGEYSGRNLEDSNLLLSCCLVYSTTNAKQIDAPRVDLDVSPGHWTPNNSITITHQIATPRVNSNVSDEHWPANDSTTSTGQIIVSRVNTDVSQGHWTSNDFTPNNDNIVVPRVHPTNSVKILVPRMNGVSRGYCTANKEKIPNPRLNTNFSSRSCVPNKEKIRAPRLNRNASPVHCAISREKTRTQKLNTNVSPGQSAAVVVDRKSSNLNWSTRSELDQIGVLNSTTEQEGISLNRETMLGEAQGTWAWGSKRKRSCMSPPPKHVMKKSRGPTSKTSKYKGVGLYKRTGRWTAHIWDSGKQVYLGAWASAVMAARAYDRTCIKLRGRKAHINFPLKDYNPELHQLENIPKSELFNLLRKQSHGNGTRYPDYRSAHTTLHG